MTGAEKKLWRAIRRDALGVRFRRQHPIGPYIADFACYPLRLILEVDGATHGSDEEREHDAARDAYLERNGWLVLRFANEAVYREPDGVVEAIGLVVRDLIAERAHWRKGGQSPAARQSPSVAPDFVRADSSPEQGERGALGGPVSP